MSDTTGGANKAPAKKATSGTPNKGRANKGSQDKGAADTSTATDGKNGTAADQEAAEESTEAGRGTAQDDGTTTNHFGNDGVESGADSTIVGTGISGTARSGASPLAATALANATYQAQDGAGSPVANSGDSGPGTGTDAPPADQHKQTKPPTGHQVSSTDHVYASAGGRTVAGETFDRLVDEDGNVVNIADVFEDDPTKTTVLVLQRVYEEFFYPNTTRKAQRLILSAHRRIPRQQAEEIKRRIAAEGV